MANSVGYHEPLDRLAPETLDMHRALASLQEELEAIDWYQQRIDVSGDADLKAVLAHNRDEEKEHAAMVLEWIRRHDPPFDAVLREYLFTSGSITAREATAETAGNGAGNAPPARAKTGEGPRPTLGSLKGEA